MYIYTHSITVYTPTFFFFSSSFLPGRNLSAPIATYNAARLYYIPHVKFILKATFIKEEEEEAVSLTHISLKKKEYL